MMRTMGSYPEPYIRGGYGASGNVGASLQEEPKALNFSSQGSSDELLLNFPAPKLNP